LLATEKGWLQCLHLHTGELIWQQRYGRGEMHQFLQIYAGTVITLDAHWQLIAFDIQSGAIRWMSRLRSAGNWCPIACGESESGAPYWAVLSREGHLAVFDPDREIKVWEGTTGMTCRQPPAAGRIGADLCLAVASNSQGLKLYKINAQYSSSAGQHP
jgi:outer membrane protein assembly factor BamB